MNKYTVFYTPAAQDRRLTDLAVRVYALLLGTGIWRAPVEIATKELADELRCHITTVRHALRQLEHTGYIARQIRGRRQLIRARHWLQAS